MNYTKEINDLKKSINQLKERWPAHSIKPNMIRDLEDLEERLEQMVEKATEKEMTKNE